jgi:hypothetical protein
LSLSAQRLFSCRCRPLPCSPSSSSSSSLFILTRLSVPSSDLVSRDTTTDPTRHRRRPWCWLLPLKSSPTKSTSTSSCKLSCDPNISVYTSSVFTHTLSLFGDTPRLRGYRAPTPPPSSPDPVCGCT